MRSVENREIRRRTRAIGAFPDGDSALMLDYCINEKHIENIWADHFTGNPASGRVMEKCGFSDTGMLNRCSQLVGGDKDMVKVFKYKGLKTPIKVITSEK